VSLVHENISEVVSGDREEDRVLICRNSSHMCQGCIESKEESAEHTMEKVVVKPYFIYQGSKVTLTSSKIDSSKINIMKSI
jgi:hypothetical protein